MKFASPVVAVVLALGSTSQAAAHGIWGHVHVTGWAVENMEEGELRSFLSEPEVFNALVFGVVFTDTGYALSDPASRAYSEHTHWEPFIEDFVQWIRVNDPPPWTSLESKKRVAFLLGCGSHGLQDTLFDSLFIEQVEHRDGHGQGTTDPASDGFLFVDGHVRFFPEADYPLETLVELYSGLSEDVTEEVIVKAVDRVTTFYVNENMGPFVGEGLAETHEASVPWMRTHYMDPAVPGSLRAEIFPTMRYQAALWERLHGRFAAEDSRVYSYPEVGRRLAGHEAGHPDSTVSLVFGAGVDQGAIQVSLTDDAGVPVDFVQEGTRWGAYWTRLVRLKPTTALEPGGWYTASVPAGLARIDAVATSEPLDFRFQVECTEAERLCVDTDPITIASIDGSGPEVILPKAVCGCRTGGNPSGLWWALGWLAWHRRRSAGAAAAA